MRGSVEVHTYLVERGIPHEFYRLERPLRRIDEAAELLGLQPSEVVAVELFEARPMPILALTPSDVCPSVEAVARAAGVARVRPASPARTAEHTGFLIHWLPPVAHEKATRVVLDPALLRPEVVYAAGGDPGVMLKIRAPDLARATAAVVAPLARAAVVEVP